MDQAGIRIHHCIEYKIKILECPSRDVMCKCGSQQTNCSATTMMFITTDSPVTVAPSELLHIAASVVQRQRAGLWYPSSRVHTRPKQLDFQGKKILSTPSFGGEVKPSVPCRSFMACKRSLNLTWKSALRQNFWTFLAHSSTFPRWVLSRGDTWW